VSSWTTRAPQRSPKRIALGAQLCTLFQSWRALACLRRCCCWACRPAPRTRARSWRQRPPTSCAPTAAATRFWLCACPRRTRDIGRAAAQQRRHRALACATCAGRGRHVLQPAAHALTSKRKRIALCVHSRCRACRRPGAQQHGALRLPHLNQLQRGRLPQHRRQLLQGEKVHGTHERTKMPCAHARAARLARRSTPRRWSSTRCTASTPAAPQSSSTRCSRTRRPRRRSLTHLLVRHQQRDNCLCTCALRVSRHADARMCDVTDPETVKSVFSRSSLLNKNPRVVQPQQRARTPAAARRTMRMHTPPARSARIRQHG
jgi:hypothetical protein